MSGYKWGGSGKCYTYRSGDEAGRKKAKEKAHLQGTAAGYKSIWIEKIKSFIGQDRGSC
tara:strand:- start:520 stop:696 length:177 start_codon:yes stop_codon:yes gene_type:complete